MVLSLESLTIEEVLSKHRQQDMIVCLAILYQEFYALCNYTYLSTLKKKACFLISEENVIFITLLFLPYRGNYNSVYPF